MPISSPCLRTRQGRQMASPAWPGTAAFSPLTPWLYCKAEVTITCLFYPVAPVLANSSLWPTFQAICKKSLARAYVPHVHACHEDGGAGPWDSRDPAGLSLGPCLQLCRASWQQSPHARFSAACICAFVLAKSPKPLSKQRVW